MFRSPVESKRRDERNELERQKNAQFSRAHLARLETPERRPGVDAGRELLAGAPADVRGVVGAQLALAADRAGLLGAVDPQGDLVHVAREEAGLEAVDLEEVVVRVDAVRLRVVESVEDVIAGIGRLLEHAWIEAREG